MNNEARYTGRLVDKPEFKELENGKMVANFSIAVQRSYPNKDGEYEADFIECEMWGKRAQTLAQYAEKGTRIGVRGETRINNFESNGKAYRTHRLIADNFTFLEKVKKVVEVDAEKTKAKKVKSNKELAHA